MKKLILPPVTGMRFRMQDLEYIQQGVLTAQAALVKSQLPDNFVGLVIVSGCRLSYAGNDIYNMTPGTLFYKPASTPDLVGVHPEGEILEFSPSSNSFTSATPPEFELYQIPEPTGSRLFVSGSYEIDLEFKLRLKTGTGIAKWNEVRRLGHIQFNNSKEKYEISTITKLPTPTFITDNFEPSGLGKLYTKYEGFAIADGDNGTSDMAGVVSIGYNRKANALTNVRLATDYLVGVIGGLFGTKEHLLTEGQLPMISPTGSAVINNGNYRGSNPEGGAASAQGIKLINRQDESTSQDIPVSLTLSTFGAGLYHENRQPSRVSIVIQKVSGWN